MLTVSAISLTMCEATCIYLLRLLFTSVALWIKPRLADLRDVVQIIILLHIVHVTYGMLGDWYTDAWLWWVFLASVHDMFKKFINRGKGWKANKDLEVTQTPKLLIITWKLYDIYIHLSSWFLLYDILFLFTLWFDELFFMLTFRTVSVSFNLQ